MKKCFTLAEVLITLAIIGVVAALTIPAVVNNYQNKMYETQYKKGVNTLVNGIRKLLSQEGVYNLGETGLMACYNLASTNRINCFGEFSNKMFKIDSDSISNFKLLDSLQSINYKLSYIEPSIFISSAMATHGGGTNDDDNEDNSSETPSPSSSNNPWNNVPYAFITTDGFIYGFSDTIQVDNTIIGFYIVMDINMLKNPNARGKDLYKFAIDDKGKIINRTCEFNSSCTNDENEIFEQIFGSKQDSGVAPASEHHHGSHSG